jgi:hypothetical protein
VVDTLKYLGQQEPAAEELLMEEVVETPDDALQHESSVREGAAGGDSTSGSAINWSPAFHVPREMPRSQMVAAQGTFSRWGPTSGQLLIPPRLPGSARTHKERQLSKLWQWQHHARQQSRLNRLCSIPAALCSIPETLCLPSERPRSLGC